MNFNSRWIYTTIMGLFFCLLAACSFTEQRLVGAAANTSAAGGPDGEWVMEGHNPQRNRATVGNIEPPLNLQREIAIDGDTQYGSPVGVANNLMLVESNRKLHAIALDSGQEQWNFDLPGFFVSPAVTGNSVFVRAESDQDGYLLALSLDAGLKLWQFKFPRVGSAENNFGGHVTSPVVSEGLVLVGADKTFRAFEAESGREAWSFKTQEPVASSATIAAGAVYFTDFTHLYAVDLKTGQELWNFVYEDETLSLLFAPIVLGEQVIVTNQNMVYVLNRHNGQPEWTQTIGAEPLVPSAAAGERVYVKSTNTLYALNRSGGEIVWRFKADDYVSLPAITDRQIFIVTREGGQGQLRALRLTDGQELWQSDHTQVANAAPVVAGGQVYVRTIDGRVLAFN